MKQIIKILFFTLLPVFSCAQVNPLFLEPTKREADSLKISLSDKMNDTLRMAAYRELALFYLDINIDSAMYYIQQDLPFAKKLNLKLWEADGLDLYGIILNYMGNYPKSLLAFNESLKLAEDIESENNIWQISKFTNGKNPTTARLNMLSTINMDFSGLYMS
ncbi:MAG TPA: hypothetical protein VLA03_10100, partial [Draconibacterium sp.]|nr:hypothetical protein [Draconibacterium sp.]